MGHTQGSFHVFHLSPLTTSFLPHVGPRGMGVLPASLSLQGLSAVLPPGTKLGPHLGGRRTSLELWGWRKGVRAPEHH